MSKFSEENKNYMDIINNPDFKKLTINVVNAFKNNGSIWYIPNFDSLNKSNDFINFVQRCFISKNLIKDNKKNYEYFEAIGDRFLKSAFMSYIVLKFPNLIMPEKINEAFRDFMSKKYQAELSRTFIPGYDKIINISYPEYNKLTNDLKESLAEDVFEAFFGAIYIWAEQSTPCSGILYISEILRRMLENKGNITEQSMASLETDPISKLTAILKQMYTLSTQEYKQSYKGDNPTSTLKIRFKTLQDEPVVLTTTGTASTTDEAKMLATKQMLEKLKEMGYDERNISNIYNTRLQNEKEVILSIKKYLTDKNIQIAEKTTSGKSRVKEYKEDFTLTVPIPKTNEIKVSYYIMNRDGEKQEISYTGKDMSRFQALRFLLDTTKRLFD